MNKTLQIFLLIMLFGASCVGGYFLGEILLGEMSIKVVTPEPQPVEIVEEIVVEPEVTYSTQPSIVDISIPKRESNGTYSFTIVADVESKDTLKYELYKDDAYTTQVTSNLDGVFTNIASSSTSTYYVSVVNLQTEEYVRCEVSGFLYVHMYQKITKTELEKLVNVDRDWSAAPKGFSSRIAPGLKIEIEGLKADEQLQVSNLAEICNKTLFNTWSSVDVLKMSYDGQGRLQHLKIKVNY